MVAERADAEVSPFLPVEFGLVGRAEVLLDMLRKDELLRQGRLEEAKKINIVVYFDGGGQAVANEAGWGRFFYEKGWFGKVDKDGNVLQEPVINTVIASSGGSVVAAYSAIGAMEATGILRMNCERNFVGGENVRRMGRPVDFEVLEENFREFPLEQEALKAVGSNIIILARDEKLRRVAFDLKEEKDPIRILQRSCNIPLVGNKADIDGHTDGALGGIPLDIIDGYHPTDVLVVGCFPIAQSHMQKQVNSTLYRVAQYIRHPLLQHVLSANESGSRALSDMFRRHYDEDPEQDPQQPLVNYAVVAPTEQRIGMFEMDWDTLEPAINGSFLAAQRMFENTQRVYGQLGM